MDTTSISLIIRAIVSGQRSVIGPMAISEANKVTGLKVSPDLSAVSVTGESLKIITDLVHQYERLFGQASIEACKDSVKEVLPRISAKDIPDFLK